MNNWIDYGLFWLYIYIHERFRLIYLMPIPMFSLFSWFLYCNTCSKSTQSMKPNGNISTEWAKVLSIVYEKLLFYREVLCFLIYNLWENSEYVCTDQIKSGFTDLRFHPLSVLIQRIWKYNLMILFKCFKMM